MVDVARFDVARFDVARFDVARFDVVRFDVARFDAARFDAAPKNLVAEAAARSGLQRERWYQHSAGGMCEISVE